MDNNKINKYINKYLVQNQTKYIKKICQHGGYSFKTVEGIMTFVLNKIKAVVPVPDNEKKYCIVLFGPPASGKSYAINYAIQLINNNSNGNLKKENFFNLNIDDFVEETFDWTLDKKNDMTDNSIAHNKQLYTNIRSNIDSIFELFLRLCILLRLNMTLETTGSSFKWNLGILKEMKNMFKTSPHQQLRDFGYNIVLMYPYTPNINLLIQRAQERGKKTGRILTEKDFLSANFVERAKSTFETEVLTNANLFYIICKYDAEVFNPTLQEDNMFVYFINKEKRD